MSGDDHSPYRSRLVATGDYTLVFADVSGYTRLTERLAALGRDGAEHLTDLVNRCFTTLIEPVLELGGDVVRFGGDAVFLAFAGPGRIERGACAAARMQRAIAAVPAIDAPGGRVRLRMSIGLHDGPVVVHEWSGTWSEHLPLGAAVTETLELEAAAGSGQVRVSASVARHLGPDLVRDGLLVVRRAASLSVPSVPLPPVPPSPLAPAVQQAIERSEHAAHRPAVVAFVQVVGVDSVATYERERAAVIDPVFTTVDELCRKYEVFVLSTDVAPDGCKLILVAGTPVATENDAERVARVTCELIERHPTVKAGVHLGVVFSGDVGHPLRRTFTVMGDSVNLAARLSGKASPGQVVVSGAVVDVIGERWVSTWLAPFFVKGKRALQRAALALVPTTDRAATGADAFVAVGRDAELDSLVGELGSGRQVQIVGAPGLGASTLVASLRRRLPKEMVEVEATVGDDHQPFAAVNRALVALGRSPVALGAGVDVMAVIDRTALELTEAIDERGCILVVERIHLADELSRAVVAELSMTEPRPHLVTTGRGVVMPTVRVIELGPLPAEQLRRIAIDHSPRPFSDAQLDRIVGLSGGSPGAVVHLSEAGYDHAAELPTSVEGAVAARLDSLPVTTRRILRKVAVLGPEIELELFLAITDERLADVVGAVERSGGLLCHTAPGRIGCRDQLVREVARRGLPAAARRPLHRVAFDRLVRTDAADPSELAFHAHGCGDHDAVLEHAERASRAAVASGLTAAAVTHAELALAAARALRVDHERMVSLLTLHGDAATSAGLLDAADRSYRQAVQLIGESDQRVPLLRKRAWLARHGGRARSAHALLSRARRLAGPDDEMSVRISLGGLAWSSGHRDRATAIVADVVDVAMRSGRFDLVAEASMLEEALRFSGGDPMWRVAGERAIVAARRSGDDALVAAALCSTAVSLDNAGRWAEALELYDASITILDRLGHVLERTRVEFNRATIQVEVGAVDPASASLGAIRRVAAAAGDWRTAASATLLALRCDARRGELDGVETFRAAVREAGAHVDQEMALFAELALVETLLLLGRPDEAMTLVLDVAERCEPFGPEHLLPAMASRLAAVSYAATGQPGQARELLRAARVSAEANGLVSEQCLTRWAAHALGIAEPEDRLDLTRFEHAIGAVSAPWYGRAREVVAPASAEVGRRRARQRRRRSDSS